MKTIPKRAYIPLVTDVLEYREAGQNTIAYARRMRERYGDVCECSFTGIKNYFIHDPQIIHEMLALRSSNMQRSYFFQAFRKFLGNGLFTAEGDLHKQQRKLIKPAFYPAAIKGYAEIMTDCAELEIEKWKNGEVININDAMNRITLQVITRTLFGSDISEATTQLVRENVTATLLLISTILLNPLHTWCLIHEIPIPVVRKFNRHKAVLDQVVMRIINDRRTNPGVGTTDLLSMLLNTIDEETGHGMSDTQIRDEVMTFFLAGHETTSLALTWSLYALMENPHEAEKAVEELKQVLPDRKASGSDYPELLRIRNILKEALRLYPPAWTFARQTKTAVELNGYHFPKHAVLWTITWLLHHDPTYFEHPEEFIPDRWNNPNSPEIWKHVYLPFGAGNRMCIGEGFAWMEGVLVLASILRQVKLKPAYQGKIEPDPVFSLRTRKSVLATITKISGSN